MESSVYFGTAPGRLDVMGGIADYSGALVLQKQIKECTTVRYTPRQDSLLIAKTFSPEEPASAFIIDANVLLKDGQVDFAHARAAFQGKAGGSWAAYVLGCLLVLQKHKGIKLQGAEFEIHSEIPEGKGVSSSAALEVATLKALQQAYCVTFQKNEIALLAQIVENQIVGAPCGLMDQLTCAFGQANHLLPIICQPDRLLPMLAIPNYVHFVGIDSGLRHHVGGASYTDVRAAAFMGYSIIAQHHGHSQDQISQALEQNQRKGLIYNGYLAGMPNEIFDKKYRNILPESIIGEEYLHLYGSSIDPHTKILPEKTYNIRQCTSHPIFENNRIAHFYRLFSEVALDEKVIFKTLGKYMHQSHDSYSTIGLGSAGTDRIVQLAKQNTSNGIYGAKITGGGSGGTVCILAVGNQGLDACHGIHQQYQKELGRPTKMFV
jgi:galactokinase